MTAEFAPLRSNLGRQVYQYLRAKIYATEIEPGTRLGVGEIAEQLNVSRSPVRDAFHLLVAEGLLVAGPAGGYHVIKFDRKYIDDVFVVRCALELAAVRLCVENGDRKRIRQLIDRWEKLRNSQEGDPHLAEDHMAADTELHHTISEMSGNAVLRDTLEKIIARAALIRRWVYSGGVPHSYFVKLAEEHLAVLCAIQAGDADAAHDALERHLRQGQVRALARLDSK